MHSLNVMRKAKRIATQVLLAKPNQLNLHSDKPRPFGKRPPKVERKPTAFIIKGGEHQAYLTYEIEGRTIKLLYTEVPEELRGHDLGKLLAKSAFEFAKINNYMVEIRCDYILNYVEKYEPLYLKLVKKFEDR